MKRTALLLVVAFVTLQGLAIADGCFMPDEQSWRKSRERSLINEPEQKAVVFFSKGMEQLIISPSYEGPSTSFAWVVPVPARPKVEILKGAVFHELAKLVMPRPRPALKARIYDSLSAAAPKVRVLERKTVGAYDVSVLAATDSKALMNWLAANKYHLPANAVKPMQSYVNERWTFVACRIKVPGDAKGLRTGTLAPLRLTFKAENPIYPLRLSAANPESFDLLVYVILRTDDIGGRKDRLALAGSPDRPNQAATLRRAIVSEDQESYPTLAKLGSPEMQVFMENSNPLPSQCVRDMIWTLPFPKK